MPECLDRAEAVARARHADLVIATDPDADRIGGLACTTADGKGEYRFLTGQELAALLTHFKLSRLANAGDLPASPIVITTEVTTGQITRIARHFNAQVIADLLVGFKYPADVLRHLETAGHYGDVQGTTADFVIATEESHGVLCTADLRDKDSACAALLMAEMALHQKRQGRTIPDYIDDLARQFGHFHNDLVNIILPGVEGKRDMARMLDKLRNDPPKAIGGLPVTSVEDLQDENGKLGTYKGATDQASRNFLIFRLTGPDGILAKVCLRPSGTEPKAKAYIEVSCPPMAPGTAPEAWQATRDRVNALAKAIKEDFSAQAKP